jgi:hypothetical protein
MDDAATNATGFIHLPDAILLGNKKSAGPGVNLDQRPTRSPNEGKL